MDLNIILTMIGSVGFPIVACVCMGWFVKYLLDENNKQIQSITNEHKREMEEVTTALNNNTIVLEKLYERLGGDNE